MPEELSGNTLNGICTYLGLSDIIPMPDGRHSDVARFKTCGCWSTMELSAMLNIWCKLCDAGLHADSIDHRLHLGP